MAHLAARSPGYFAARTAYFVGAFLMLSGLVHVGILIATGASWEGPLSWRKAATFGLSFGLTLTTVVWVSSFLRLSPRARSRLIAVFTIACTVETALVTLQVWRGVPSHFNVETSIDSWIARTLALGGAALVAVILTLTLASFRKNPGVPISQRVAIRVGFMALTGAQIAGALMIARGMRLVFAGHPATAYATGGVLKPSHAVTMHAIQLLPVLAWLLSFTAWTERRRLLVVLLAAVGYAALAATIILTNLQAL
jgi:hypothetical protein